MVLLTVLKAVRLSLSIVHTIKIVRHFRWRKDGRQRVRVLTLTRQTARDTLAIWVVWVAVQSFESLASPVFVPIHRCLPFPLSLLFPYPTLMLLVHLYLLGASIAGASFIFGSFLRPAMARYEAKVDLTIGLVHAVANLAGTCLMLPISLLLTWAKPFAVPLRLDISGDERRDAGHLQEEPAGSQDAMRPDETLVTSIGYQSPSRGFTAGTAAEQQMLDLPWPRRLLDDSVSTPDRLRKVRAQSQEVIASLDALRHSVAMASGKVKAGRTEIWKREQRDSRSALGTSSLATLPQTQIRRAGRVGPSNHLLSREPCQTTQGSFTSRKAVDIDGSGSQIRRPSSETVESGTDVDSGFDEALSGPGTLRSGCVPTIHTTVSSSPRPDSLLETVEDSDRDRVGGAYLPLPDASRITTDGFVPGRRGNHAPSISSQLVDIGQRPPLQTSGSGRGSDAPGAMTGHDSVVGSSGPFRFLNWPTKQTAGEPPNSNSARITPILPGGYRFMRSDALLQRSAAAGVEPSVASARNVDIIGPLVREARFPGERDDRLSGPTDEMLFGSAAGPKSPLVIRSTTSDMEEVSLQRMRTGTAGRSTSHSSSEAHRSGLRGLGAAARATHSEKAECGRVFPVKGVKGFAVAQAEPEDLAANLPVRPLRKPLSVAVLGTASETEAIQLPARKAGGEIPDPQDDSRNFAGARPSRLGRQMTLNRPLHTEHGATGKWGATRSGGAPFRMDMGDVTDLGRGKAMTSGAGIAKRRRKRTATHADLSDAEAGGNASGPHAFDTLRSRPQRLLERQQRGPETSIGHPMPAKSPKKRRMLEPGISIAGVRARAQKEAESLPTLAVEPELASSQRLATRTLNRTEAGNGGMPSTTVALGDSQSRSRVRNGLMDNSGRAQRQQAPIPGTRRALEQSRDATGHSRTQQPERPLRPARKT